MVLAKIAIHLQLDEEMVESPAVADKLISYIRNPTGSWGEWQILRFGWLMQLHGVDIRESVAEVQTLYRMDVDARLTTQNAGVARSKLIGWRVVDEDRLIVLICQLLAIDVMVDAIGKQRELCRNDRRRIIQTKVELPAVFWLQTGISQFVSLGSLVHTIR